MDCHLPYRLREPHRFRFVAPADRRRAAAVPQDPFAAMAGVLELSPEDLEDLKALYDGSLYYLDEQVGLLDASWCSRFPPELAARLSEILTNPEK